MRAALPPLVGAFLVVIAVAAAPPAAAHATRIATDPAVNATLISGPPRVSATFNEHLQDTFAAMTVVGPDGNLWSTGQSHVDGAIVSVDVLPLGPVGTYTVNYRVTSADGHVVSGSWSFQLTVAGTGRPGPPPLGRVQRNECRSGHLLPLPRRWPPPVSGGLHEILAAAGTADCLPGSSKLRGQVDG